MYVGVVADLAVERRWGWESAELLSAVRWDHKMPLNLQF